MKIIEKIITFVLTVTLSGAVLYYFNFIGFHYVRFVENVVLNSPVSVAGVSQQRILLADGRVIAFTEIDHSSLQKIIRNSGDIVEIKPLSSDDVAIYVQKKNFYCETWAPEVIIPIIPVDRPKYSSREFLTTAQFVTE